MASKIVFLLSSYGLNGSSLNNPGRLQESLVLKVEQDMIFQEIFLLGNVQYG